MAASFRWRLLNNDNEWGEPMRILSEQPKKPSSVEDRPAVTTIAVVGMACQYPGARDPLQLWENVIAQRREFRRMPNCRTPLSEYYDPDPAAPDKFYQARIGAIDGFIFDWAKYRIPQSTYDCTDIAQWLALEIASRALADAGYDRNSVPKERTGAFVGNTDTGEQMRANTMRLRWPFVRRAVMSHCHSLGMSADQAADFANRLESVYKSPLPQVSEDFLAGSIAAPIAGRICNYFDLNGGAYVVDGACASSLVSVYNACDMLAGRDLDLALAGGVDISLDPMELVGFSKAGALSKTEMTPYDRRADGFVPAEGSGFVVLKRLEDARAAGDYVYAVIRGWGMSSDGRAGIMQPTSKGQSLAVRRAWSKAGLSLRDVRLLEGHGTGTRLGDKTELEGLGRALEADGATTAKSCAVGSIKSVIGHAKAAAGVASLIKTVTAVNRRIMPATASVDQPNAAFESSARQLFPIQMSELLPASEVLHAGVSAFGFGGINVHLALESGDAPNDRLKPAIDERALFVSGQDSELFVFSASSVGELISRLKGFVEQVRGHSLGELVDLAAQLGADVRASHRVRAAVIACLPEELGERLEFIIESLVARPPSIGATWAAPEKQVWVGNEAPPPKLGFLFPGQGSQQLLMGRFIVERFDWARELAQQADAWAVEAGGQALTPLMFRRLDRASSGELADWVRALEATHVAQPAICLTSVLFVELLRRLGVRPSAVCGHSLGELTAFHVAGAFNFEVLIKLATVRGLAMAAPAGVAGAMASIGCSPQQAANLLKGAEEQVVVANLNSPSQVVISGDEAAVMQITANATALGLIARRLPVSNAFHSPFVNAACAVLAKFSGLPAVMPSSPLQLYSSVAAPTCESPLVAPGLSLKEHFVSQVVAPVDFIRTVEGIAAHCGVLIEVGPGRALSGLASDILAGGATPCLPVAGKAQSAGALQAALATAFISGINIDWGVLYLNRLVRPYVEVSKLVFVESPTERPLAVLPRAAGEFARSAAGGLLEHALGEVGASAGQIQNYLNARGQFLADLGKLDYQHSKQAGGKPATEARTDTTVMSGVSEPQTVATKPALNLEAALVDLVSKRTGYPVGSIQLEARLLDDLNIDSIKSGELVASIARLAGVAGKIDGTQFANASLRDVLAAVRAARPSEAANVSHLQSSVVPVEAFLIQLVAKRTGFPPESVRLELRILDDLNIDSIKSGEIVAAAAREYGAVGRIDSTAYSNSTLAEVASAIRAAAPGADAGSRVIPSPVEVTPDALTVLMEEICKVTGFPSGSVIADLTVDLDLQLDVAKLHRAIQAAAGALGIEATLDLEPLRKRTIRQIANVLGVLAKGSTSGLAPERTIDIADLSERSWLRHFAFEPELDNREAHPRYSGRRTEDNWVESSVLIACEEVDLAFAEALKERVSREGGQVAVHTYDDVRVKGLTKDLRFTHLVGLLPRAAAEVSDARSLYAPMVERLLTLATPSLAGRAPRRRTTVAWLQFGGGSFGMGAAAADAHACGTVGFAKSLHHERSDLRIRVVDLSAGVSADDAGTLLMREISTPEAFVAVGFDAQLQRRVLRLRLQDPKEYLPRTHRWSATDVIMVTGGGKGVMAECALGIARATGATVVLVGSSPAPAAAGAADDLGRTLERFRREKLKHHYFSCDVTDEKAVEALVKRVSREVGVISGVVHGAVILKGAKAQDLSVRSIMAEIAPKILGIANLCKAFEECPPKLMLGFTSISQLTGAPGNLPYAFSNEVQENILRRFEQRHPQTQIQCVGWGVWGDAGWGTKQDNINKLDNMARGGLLYAKFSSEDGVRAFTKLIECDPGARHVLVSGRVIGFDTWAQLRPPPTSPDALRRPFIDAVRFHEPEVELIVRKRLSVDRETFLKDHMVRGMYVMPTVFCLEAMAQVAAACAALGLEVARMENVEMPWPLVVDAERGLEIELRAEVITRSHGEAHVRVAVTTEQSNFSKEVLRSVIVLGPRATAPRAEVFVGNPVDIVPTRDLYGQHFFVGPLFQRMQQVLSIDPNRSVSRAEYHQEAAAGGEGFSPRASTSLLLGDGFLRDTAIHTAFLHDLSYFAFTSTIARIDFFQVSGVAGSERLCVAKRVAYEAKALDTEIEVMSTSGEVFEKWVGYRLTVVDQFHDLPTAAELVSPDLMRARDQRIIEASVTVAAKELSVTAPTVQVVVSPQLKASAKARRHEVEAELGKLTARERLGMGARDSSRSEVKWSANGRPEFKFEGSQEQALQVSFSIDEPYCVASVAESDQGCDLTSIVERNRDEWLSILGTARAELLLGLVTAGESIDRAGARIWGALEAARKATSQLEQQLTVVRTVGSHVLMNAKSTAGEVYIVTSLIRLTRAPERVLAWVGAPNPKSGAKVSLASSAATDVHQLYSLRVEADASLGCNVLRHHFQVNLRDCNTASGRVQAVNFVAWFKNACDLMLGEQLGQQFASEVRAGSVSGVTRNTRVTVDGEANVYDRIEIKIWVSRLADAEVICQGEIYRLNGDRPQRLARLSTEVVSLGLGAGTLEVRPFSNELHALFTQYLAKTPVAHNQAVAPLLVGAGSLVSSQKLTTSMLDSDLMGNINNGMYFSWQVQARDEFFRTVHPTYIDRSRGEPWANVEPICSVLRVDYLREALPFDTIQIDMFVESASAREVGLRFDYYRVKDNTKEKLAVGYQELQWMGRTSSGALIPSTCPAELAGALATPKVAVQDADQFQSSVKPIA